MSPEELAKLGTAHLEEAVLRLLLAEEPLSAPQLARRLVASHGYFTERPYKGAMMMNAVLDKLRDRGLVTAAHGKRYLTDEGRDYLRS